MGSAAVPLAVDAEAEDCVEHAPRSGTRGRGQAPAPEGWEAPVGFAQRKEGTARPLPSTWDGATLAQSVAPTARRIDVDPMRPLLLSSLVLLGVADPTCVPPTSQDAPEESKAELANPGDCLAACAGGKTLSETDQQTCRLLCEKKGADPSPATTLLARFDLCTERCEPGQKTDATTCALNCEQSALSSLNVEGDARTCAAACLEGWRTCRRTCVGNTTDAQTCRLQCEETAKSCADGCMK